MNENVMYSRHPLALTVVSLGEGAGGPPPVTPSRGDTPNKTTFLWLNLQRTLDKRRGKMGVVRRGQLKKVITFQRAMTTTKRSPVFFKG